MKTAVVVMLLLAAARPARAALPQGCLLFNARMAVVVNGEKLYRQVGNLIQLARCAAQADSPQPVAVVRGSGLPRLFYFIQVTDSCQPPADPAVRLAYNPDTQLCVALPAPVN